MKFTECLRQLHSRGWRYWLAALTVVLFGVFVGNWMDDWEIWRLARYKIYQFQQYLSPRKPYDTHTTVVLIGDKEYWEGELARRAPVKRSYLKKMVEVLDQSEAAVIALDFDFRSSVPDGSMPTRACNVKDPKETLPEHQDYVCETLDLFETIKDVAQRRTVVLPRAVTGDSDHGYSFDANVYDNFNFDHSLVKKGYVILNNDLRELPPLTLKLRNGESVELYAAITARAANPEALDNAPDNPLFGGYLLQNQIKSISSSQLLSGDAEFLRNNIAHRVVILGADWHTQSEGRGRVVDWHETPAGGMPGAFLHANWVEALLDRRISPAMGDGMAQTIEIMSAVLVALVMGLRIAFWRRLVSSVVLALLVMGMSYVFAQNFGVFFDFLIPTVMVCAHVTGDRIWEWRSDARELDELRKAGMIMPNPVLPDRKDTVEARKNAVQVVHERDDHSNGN